MTEPPSESPSGRLFRRLPFILIGATALVVLIWFPDLISFESLQSESRNLLALRDAHYLLTSLAFVLIYVLVVVLSVPGATILTLSGGFLFGVFPGVIYTVMAASIGATLVFIAARAGFGRDVAERIRLRGGAVGRLQAGLKEHEWSVLLTMRLIPVVPFFIANLVPAFVGVGLASFAITTFLGIIPAALIFTALGAGLGEVFARGEVPRLDILFTAKFGLPLLGLALLSSLPLLLRLVGRRT